MFRVGVDLVSVPRMREAVERTPRIVSRVFSPQEVSYCMGKADPYSALAVRFAAREALRKLHPVFIKNVRFRDVEVVRGSDGRPSYLLSPALMARAKEAGMVSLDLSLTHDGEQAVAVAVAEWQEREG